MQAKLILVELLLEFSIEIGDKTYVPLRYAKGLRLEPEGGSFVNLKKRI